MRKTILFATIIAFFTTCAYAGVSRIASNGNINGASSYRVECSSGSDYIIYKKGGTWFKGGSGHMGNKYNSWSKDEVANYLCN